MRQQCADSIANNPTLDFSAARAELAERLSVKKPSPETARPDASRHPGRDCRDPEAMEGNAVLRHEDIEQLSQTLLAAGDRSSYLSVSRLPHPCALDSGNPCRNDDDTILDAYGLEGDGTDFLDYTTCHTLLSHFENPVAILPGLLEAHKTQLDAAKKALDKKDSTGKKQLDDQGKLLRELTGAITAYQNQYGKS